MKITREGEYQISITDEGSILVRYDGGIDIVMLRKIKRLENSYKLISNFASIREKRVTKAAGIREAKELLLANKIAAK